MQLSRTRIVAGVAAATLSLAFLAGCGEDEPQPKFEDPTSASPSKSASPEEPVEPTPPAAMEGDDVAGAKAFATYYFELLDYARLSGSTQTVEALALPTCVACKGATTGIKDTHASGGTYTGGQIAIRKVEMADLGSTQGVKTFRGLLWVHTSREVVRNSRDASRNGVHPPSDFKVEFVAQKDAAGWHVGEWKPL